MELLTFILYALGVYLYLVWASEAVGVIQGWPKYVCSIFWPIVVLMGLAAALFFIVSSCFARKEK